MPDWGMFVILVLIWIGALYSWKFARQARRAERVARFHLETMRKMENARISAELRESYRDNYAGEYIQVPNTERDNDQD